MLNKTYILNLLTSFIKSSALFLDCSGFSLTNSVFSTIISVFSAIDVSPCAPSSANFLTSSATTANPFPAYPALAASIAAFSANKFV